jgi:probable phosphoglycerate mutase
MMTNLYLIRHGEAFSNVEPIMGGMRGDRGLTDRGMAQVQALTHRLARGEIAADVLYASTLPRARMTAEPVAEALDLPIHWDDDLQELRPGEADGMHIDEARSRFPQMSLFFKEYFTPIAPDGESWASFQFRASAALERLITHHRGQTIVAVCHGGIIEVSFLFMLGLGPHARGRNAFHVQNTAITHWRQMTSRDGRLEWQLITHNDCWHLRELESERDRA